MPREGAMVLVIDTNIVLDLYVFDDPRWVALHRALAHAGTRWLATDAMRGELTRVLDYPAIRAWRERTGRDAATVLRRFDARTERVPAAPAAPWRCADADDQPFIDLALAWRATLLSKDRAVLRLARRAATRGVPIRSCFAEVEQT
ncbi:MAG: PIN domain-containing protein [Burkholderiales bacterium]|nr:PIN domain-containing protein [Burkholderiales bacterium]